MTTEQQFSAIRQKNKWNELETFFKNNSKHYKQIDNGDIVFSICPPGGASGFIHNLFLNNLQGAKVSTDDTLLKRSLNHDLEGENTFFEEKLIWFNPYRHDDNQTTMSFDSFKLLKELYIPTTEEISVLGYERVDENLFNCLSDTRKKVNDTSYFVSHVLPVIPFFYYKNIDKIKILLIDITEQQLIDYTKLLSVTKAQEERLMDYDKLYTFYEIQLIQEEFRDEAIELVLNTFEEIKTITNNNETINGLLAELLIQAVDVSTDRNERNYYLKEHFKTKLTEYINTITLNEDSIDFPDEDVFTGKWYSGMMDHLSTDQLIRVDYRKLIMEQDHDLVVKMFSLFKGTETINHYKDMIKEYHALNFELVNLIKNDLSSASMAMPS